LGIETNCFKERFFKPIKDVSTYGDDEDAKHALKLKAKPADWDGEDDFGFKALPGGRQDSGIFDSLGILTEFVSCTDYNFTTAILRKPSA
jgi:hypothetical protein